MEQTRHRPIRQTEFGGQARSGCARSDSRRGFGSKHEQAGRLAADERISDAPDRCSDRDRGDFVDNRLGLDRPRARAPEQREPAASAPRDRPERLRQGLSIGDLPFSPHRRLRRIAVSRALHGPIAPRMDQRPSAAGGCRNSRDSEQLRRSQCMKRLLSQAKMRLPVTILRTRPAAQLACMVAPVWQLQTTSCNCQSESSKKRLASP